MNQIYKAISASVIYNCMIYFRFGALLDQAMRFGSVRVVKHRMTWIFGGYKNPIQESSKVVGLVTQDFGSDILVIFWWLQPIMII
jgi:hypothetical protein